MRRPSALAAILVFSNAAAIPADWLNYGGDPQRSAWQKREKILNTGTVQGLRLLWKRQLDHQANGLNFLTAPVILGRIVTHRGAKELVFVAENSNHIYAVDADLGTLFWTRQFDSPASESKSKPPCGWGLTAAPALAADPAGGSTDDTDDDDDAPTPMRPLYIVSSDGRLHTLRPSDGADLRPPVQFIPPNAYASSLILSGDVIYTTTSHGYGGAADGVWTLEVKKPDATAAFFRANDRRLRAAGISVGPEGAFLLSSQHSTWHKRAGVAGKPVAPMPQVIANGIVFILADSDLSRRPHATLYAFDARTGEQLYSSGDAITSVAQGSGLAVANGHVCLGTHASTLYCFGFPVDL